MQFKEITKIGGIVIESQDGERLIGTEIDEDRLEIAPGVAEDFGNTFINNAEDQSDDVMPDGSWVKRRVYLRSVQPVDLPAAAPHGKEIDTAKNVPETTVTQDSLAKAGLVAVDLRKSVREENYEKPDGTRVRKIISETRHVQLVEKSTKEELGKPGRTSKDADVSEKLVGIEIVEDVLEVTPGVVNANDRNVQSKTSDSETSDVLPDGTWQTKKIHTTIIRPVKEQDVFAAKTEGLLAEQLKFGPVELKKQHTGREVRKTRRH
jgi:hypothetical protein